ncbi:MAG: NADH-quinone oxidoreductase subunit N [Chloroflexi bacterium]|nr:MAG: NADH-quinone oxidoreductase subunit N [Chloroflexota bacterium]
MLGAFSSALLVYGFAWLFGVTGSTRYTDITAALKAGGIANGPTIIALSLVTVGLGFKAAVVPFHQWTPDAYDGAPTPATAFMSVGPKAAAFAAILRVLVSGMGSLVLDWSAVFAVLAAITMTAGNVVALAQPNVKRMLAYSSIAHTGYILAGLTAFAAARDTATAQRGIEAVLFYVLGYGVMNVAAFAVVGMLQRDTRRFGGMGSFAGLASRDPWRAAAMAILLLSLTGIPPTVGFFAKLYVLVATVNAGLGWLAVVIALNAALAAFYYLRVIVTMYMRDPESEPAPIDHATAGNLGLVLSVLGVLLLGLFPDRILELLRISAGSLF